jgi:putative ABC transport system permease protein
MTGLSFANATSLALETIRAHKMRSLLTVLGVIIGTGTIIGVGAILTGFDSTITAVLRSFGPNSIIVFKFPVGFRMGDLTPEERLRKNFTYENTTNLRERCSACKDVSPMLFAPGGIINARYKGNDIYDINLFGVEEGYAREGQVDLHAGRFFSEEESRHHVPVCVIGADIEKALFANEDPIGKVIAVDGRQLEVIGTMIRPAASFFGDDDKRVLVPFFTMHRIYPTANEIAIVANAYDGRLPEAIDETRTVLRIDRHVPFDKPDDFALSTADQMVSDFRQITAMTFLVMVTLSSIGLLVGGIGVMNIMQFLLEAAVLTGLGGFAGIAFGWIVAAISRLVFSSLPAAVPAWAAILGVGMSVAVGLFFGIWPANKAARLDPVEALRYE